MNDQTPAQELTAAADALQDPDIDACQHPGCGCPDELHYRDADGVVWCKDCYDQHSFRPAHAADIPGWLRGPLADWLEREAVDCEATAEAARLAWPGDGEEAAQRHAARPRLEALAVARAILGSPS